METLSRTQELDQRHFWQLVNKKHKPNVCPVQSEGGDLLIEPDAIRDEWTTYYKDLFSDHDDPSWDTQFKIKVENEIKNIDTSHRVILEGGPVTKKEVCNELNKMKCRKAPGWDNVTVEHFKHGGENTKAVITFVINLIIHSEVIPEYCKKGILVPIPKHNKDKTVKDNNRGITLLPVIFKLLEKVLMEREKSWLQENIDPIQSAGQPHCSSLHTSFLVQEVISYNVNKGSTVYSAFLDTRKAFDTVWIDGLMHKLYKKGMS